MVTVPEQPANAGSPRNATRRSHRKSRNGCAQCKRRHMKCDEHRPVCANCSASDRSCSFSDRLLSSLPEASETSVESDSSLAAPTNSICSSAASPSSLGAVVGANSAGTSQHPIEGLSSHVYDLTHLRLLHHLEIMLLRPDNAGLIPDGVDTTILVDTLMNSAVAEPYLMDEMLAVSALHLSTLASTDAEKQCYYDRAAQLQTRALTVFNTIRPAVSEENCISMFLFSGTLGLHTLFDSASFHGDFTEFLEKFIQFLSLHRGIRTVTRKCWHVLRHTEIRHIVNAISQVEQLDPHLGGSSTECDYLMTLLEASSESLGPMVFTACHEAVKWLQWIILQRRNLQRPLQTHVVLAWPVLISFDYLQVLRQRRPEAMVILAHWAVFLHHDRDFWVFGDSGRFLIESTSKYMGSYWDDWMAWPNAVLEGR